MKVREAMTYRSQGPHDSVYISSTDGCDRAEGMHLLANASQTCGRHNKKEARPSELKRGDQNDRCLHAMRATSKNKRVGRTSRF